MTLSLKVNYGGSFWVWWRKKKQTRMNRRKWDEEREKQSKREIKGEKKYKTCKRNKEGKKMLCIWERKNRKGKNDAEEKEGMRKIEKRGRGKDEGKGEKWMRVRGKNKLIEGWEKVKGE